MRILFLLSGSLWTHTLPEGFLEAGHEVKTIAIGTEQEVSETLSVFRPDLVMSIGWGIEQNKKNQLLIRKCVKETKVPHVYWSVEDPQFTLSFSLPLIQLSRPDFIFTICPQTADFYRKLGIRSVHMDFGFSTKIHFHIPCTYKSSIAVVANAYPTVLQKYPEHYRIHSLKTLILPLLKENIQVDFWGKDWDKIKSILNYDIPGEWLHGYIPYKNANEIYSSARIILGLQNYEHQVTQRTYEILASKGFLLTSDTPAVRRLFKPGKDLMVSSCPQETLEVISYYLNRPDECNIIKSHGEKSVQGSSYKNRAEYMIRVLKKEKIID